MFRIWLPRTAMPPKALQYMVIASVITLSFISTLQSELLYQLLISCIPDECGL